MREAVLLRDPAGQVALRLSEEYNIERDSWWYESGPAPSAVSLRKSSTPRVDRAQRARVALKMRRPLRIASAAPATLP